ncbi:Sjogren's syndrome/scleroderma autoantigen 1 family protein [Halomicroarcula sp. GCM10025324]|uniref:Sjogren's syndrome/scleroderma autoantigen 1 family protein n=1 Tax=Haloarcula TaxID=2237 RepID=UPI0023E7FB15|nr:Sjogren's syndrome/scleroderma autoantigen 1 family protein [Halomicroarcula sp. ZS-22-S1]
MSDFDKEAEREKLREKFEAEEEKRQATEQMSELLLKGATMTNAHCSDCGDPVFRYDGQEFCPTCQKPITREPAEEGSEGDDGGDRIEVANPGDEARVQFGNQAESGNEGPDQPAERTEEPPQADESHPQPGSATGPRETVADSGVANPADQPAEVQTNGTTTESAAEGSQSIPSADPSVSSRTIDENDGVQGDVAAAERLLAQTLRQYSERAANTDNPRRAREHLEAAREAAEALDALQF